jgi:2-succinyl-6-hydroxy-2,4-cyclohexadiene-1-carboxylate synthase
MKRISLSHLFSLNIEQAGSGPPLVLLHGFTGSAASWSPLIDHLNHHFTTLAVDIVGHGFSDKPDDLARYQMKQAVRDLVRVVSSVGAYKAHWLGYSMGGRTALHVAASHPGSVDRLVLIGASPGIADEAERQARVEADEQLARRIEREGVPAFIDYWESIPLFESQRSLPDDVRARIRQGRLRNTATGLANSLRGMGAGAQAPLHQKLSDITAPTLIMAGELDSKYVSVGQEMAEAMPGARFVAVPAAGHAAHTENPEACGREIVAFLQEDLQANEGKTE